MQAAEAPNSDSDIQSKGTTSTTTVKKKRKFLDSQNVYDFCIIIYKSIILFDLKVMKDGTGIFRKGFAVIVCARTWISSFMRQKTLIFLEYDLNRRMLWPSVDCLSRQLLEPNSGCKPFDFSTRKVILFLNYEESIFLLSSLLALVRMARKSYPFNNLLLIVLV